MVVAFGQQVVDKEPRLTFDVPLIRAAVEHVHLTLLWSEGLGKSADGQPELGQVMLRNVTQGCGHASRELGVARKTQLFEIGELAQF